MRLFFFTFVGGSGSFFNGLASSLRPDIEVVKLEYAGHMERRHEPFYRDFDELAADMYGQVKVRAGGGPYALFGYSMGSIVAAQVLQRIQGSDGPDTDETIKQWTVRFGGLPEKLVNSPTFWRIYMPIYRADYELITNYDFSRLDFVSDIPATVLYSPADIPRGDMEKWRRVFTGECDIQEYDGGHFFLREHEREVADVVDERLKDYDI